MRDQFRIKASIINDAILILSILVMAGCASTHDLDKDKYSVLGGGFSEKTVSEGIYYIYERTNWAPSENLSGARDSWHSRAEAHCVSGKIRELDIQEYSYDKDHPYERGIPFGAIYILTVKEGYAICETIKLSDEEVRALIYGGGK